MSDESIPVVTIDGPAGSGKGTIAIALARNLGYHYLDSGALYRILAYLSQQQNLTSDQLDEILSLCRHMDLGFKLSDSNDFVEVQLNGEDVTQRIRTEDCAAQASKLAAEPKIRQQLMSVQQSFCKSPGLVAEGRDMGTVVFPYAEHKFYLTASPSERALRRQKQLKKQGISASLDRLLNEIEARDERDSVRANSPLRPAEDAVLVDSTNLSIEEVMQHILEIVDK